MSVQSNSSKRSRRLLGVILLTIGVFLLVAEFLLMTVLPNVVQNIAAAQTAAEGFGTIKTTIDEEIEPVVAQEVAAAQAADAGDAPKFAVEEETESAVAVEPVFVVEPGVRTGVNVLGVFRIVGSLIAIIFVGVGIYVLITLKALRMTDDQAALARD